MTANTAKTNSDTTGTATNVPFSDSNSTTIVNVFDTLDGKFLARLREIVSNTRNTADGKATITFKTAKIEANYSPDIIKKIETGRLVAIPNVMGVGSNDTYSIYEVADVFPMHYSMLTLDKSQPGAIRKEFMMLIEKEWHKGSKSTWIEIIAAPTGYILQLDKNGTNNDDNPQEPKFVRKVVAPLAGSEVYLLGKEIIQKFICYTPKQTTDIENSRIGSLLGVTEDQVPFIINLEKLLHYHVGVFAYTGAGKSNLTSLIIRKAIKSVPDLKFVIFDVSSEYGINILDILRTLHSRVVLTEPLRAAANKENSNDNNSNNRSSNLRELAADYLRRHVSPEALAEVKDAVLLSIEEVISQDKIRTLAIPSDSEQGVLQFSTYGGLLRSVSDIANEKFAAAGQKVLIPSVMDKIKKFMRDKKLDEDSPMGLEILPLIKSILERLTQAKLRADALIISIFHNLQLTIEDIYSQSGGDEVIFDGEESVNKDRYHHGEYDAASLVNEIMDPSKDSPRIFVINLPEADVARLFCTEIINRVFKNRKNTFTLDPRIVFVFDEAQEFIPYEKRKEDGTEYSSRAVERLLRHGRKYFLHGWISTQRVAHLNTNALQQLHSYFVSTMPRPYDRQLISDTFAIDDAFVDRTLMFQNGDWLMTSFKATNTQNVPVFFHAINNEDSILD